MLDNQYCLCNIHITLKTEDPAGNTMQPKKILIAAVLGGFLLLITTVLGGVIANVLMPYNIFEIPGMRPMTDPVAVLFFFYPFVLAFAGALLFDFMHMVLKGENVRKGVVFGMLLFILVTIPNQFVIWSSMYYPTGFYLSSILSGIIGFPLFGILCATLWGKEGVETLKKEYSTI